MIKKVKVVVRALQERLERGPAGSRIQQGLWAFRHLYKRDFANGNLNTVDHPHRKQIVDAVASFQDAKSMLEIGCASGPNFVCIRERIPDIAYLGIDINASAIRVARGRFVEPGKGDVRFEVGRIDKLSSVGSRGVDVVLSDAVLMFVAPERIGAAIAEICRVARQGIVLNEYHLPGVIDGKFDGGRWIYDLVALIRRELPDAGIETLKSDFEGGLWSQCGTLIKVRI